MRLLIVTDAWHPQVNGVVTTLSNIGQEICRQGYDVSFLTPEGKTTIPMPTYPEIRIALTKASTIARQIRELRPDYIHIATEGPLGWLARSYCRKNDLDFTTSFHSRFPEYFSERLPLPGLKDRLYSLLRRFHGSAKVTLAPTRTVTERLRTLGFSNVETWTRGVDQDIFYTSGDDPFSDLHRPIYLNAGRVAVEKNIPAFLDLDLPGTKVVVGDGPQLAQLRHKYPDTVFTGYRKGKQLADSLASADVFVFPSRTDTFGLVMLEALACGTPVAAYPVEGPIDIITSAKVGALNDDLRLAVTQAINCNSEDCIAFADEFSWENAANIFMSYLHPVS